MTPMAITIATTITGMCSAMPTAVSTESIENTRSIRKIWTTTMPKVALARPLRPSAPGSIISCISLVAL